MAKALLGHVGSDLDVRVALELRRLKDRVRELEAEVDRLQAANRELSSGLVIDGDILSISVGEPVADREPALT
jgi:hypothetical protein